MGQIQVSNDKEALLTSIKGELKAHLSYLEFAKKAEDEGFPNIARVFKALAEAERIHMMTFGRLYFGRNLTDDDIKNLAKDITIEVHSTKENLETGLKNENYENTELYQTFADISIKSNPGAYIIFKQTANAEGIHRDIFSYLLELVKKGQDLKASEKIFLCPVCGYIVLGKKPAKCPICNEPEENFIEF